MTQLMVLDCRQMSRTSFGRRSIASVRASAVDARVSRASKQTHHTRLMEEGRFWTSTLPLFGNCARLIRGNGLVQNAVSAGK